MKKITTPEEFEKLKQSDSVSIVKFGIVGCMPCMMAEETLSEMESSIDATIYTCDNIDLMTDLGITNMPVIFIVGNGKNERIDAFELLDELEEIINEKLGVK